MVNERLHELAVSVQILVHSSGVGWLRCRLGDSATGSMIVDFILIGNDTVRVEGSRASATLAAISRGPYWQASAGTRPMHVKDLPNVAVLGSSVTV